MGCTQHTTKCVHSQKKKEFLVTNLGRTQACTPDHVYLVISVTQSRQDLYKSWLTKRDPYVAGGPTTRNLGRARAIIQFPRKQAVGCSILDPGAHKALLLRGRIGCQCQDLSLNSIYIENHLDTSIYTSFSKWGKNCDKEGAWKALKLGYRQPEIVKPTSFNS